MTRALTSLLCIVLWSCAKTSAEAAEEPLPLRPVAPNVAVPGSGQAGADAASAGVGGGSGGNAGNAGLGADNPVPPVVPTEPEPVVPVIPEPDPMDPICDGSEGIRLGVTGGGGFVPSSYTFTYPIGTFLFVDGNCHYYASGDYILGIHEGMLDEEEALDLARAVGFSSIADWQFQPGDNPNCADGGTTTIMRPGASTSCYCGCDPMQTPPEMKLAIENAAARLANLAKRGSLLQGDLAGAAEVTTQPASSPLAWPLSRSIVSIDGLLSVDGLFNATGARFTDASETAALRRLRMDAIAAGTTWAAEVDDAGTTYLVYLRDELPEDVELQVYELLHPPLGGP